MKIEQIKSIYQQLHTPPSIIKHMQAVADFSLKICDKLEAAGHAVNREEIYQAALLHDALRMIDINNFDNKRFPDQIKPEDHELWEKLKEEYSNVRHERAMESYLQSINENNLARIVGKHGFVTVDQLKELDEKVLFYADKRIEGDQLVSLKKRFEEGRKRNLKPGENLEKIEQIEKKVYELESELEILVGSRI